MVDAFLTNLDFACLFQLSLCFSILRLFSCVKTKKTVLTELVLLVTKIRKTGGVDGHVWMISLRPSWELDHKHYITPLEGVLNPLFKEAPLMVVLSRIYHYIREIM
ncbi:hypothetical protein QVD17_14947 [Tagetes erecta]|uniref:Uncharacterized protein n=1 Tax=Tagetes erecta TaxID=13708 RepID=A0AAD8KNT2_TARER|nr:hypothetical protein QVD17_14947 [Tagetes erecta]